MKEESRIPGLRRLFRLPPSDDRIERDVDEELRFHLESRVADLVARGTAVDDARRIAEEEYGDVTASRAEIVKVDRRAHARLRRADLLDIARQDVTYALRGIRRRPGFAVSVTLTLALAVGANAAIFTIVDPLFFRAPPGVVNPNELRRVYQSRPSYGSDDPTVPTIGMRFSYPNYRSIRAALAGTARLAALTGRDSVAVIRGTDTVLAAVRYATADYLPILGTHAQRGRLFAEAEDDVNAPARVAVISDRFARRAFGDSADPIGRELRVAGNVHTVIGVTPLEFAGDDWSAADIWMPFSTNPILDSRNGTPWYQLGDSYIPLIARLTPNVDHRAVAARATAAYRNGYDNPPKAIRESSILLGPLSVDRGPATRSKETLITTRMAGVALLVLLIACANVANLLLARAIARRREIAVRLALGISRARLAFQVLLESIVLAVFAGVASLVVAVWGGGVLRAALMPRIRWAEGPVGLRVLVFTMTITVVAGALAGVVPALLGSRHALAETLKAGARDGGHRRGRIRAGLLVVQAALSIVLLVGAALFAKSLRNVRNVRMGYDVDRLVVASLYFPDRTAHPEVKTLLPDVAGRLASMPGVASAMVTYGAPLDSWISNSLYRSGTGSDSARLLSVQPYFIGVPTEYFAVTRTRILNGRAFLPSDRAGTAPVIIVGDRLARDLWPGESAIGKCFIPLKPTNPCYTVVGVAQDVHHFQIVNRATETQYYFPLAQLPDPRSIPKSLVIRAGSLEPEPIARLVREEIRHAFPDAQVRAVPMSQALAPQLLPWRLGAELFTALSLLALAVAAIGVYGVVAFDVNQRVHEMGIRIALGAYTPRLIWLVVGQGTRIVAVGVVLGLLSALAAGKLVASMLYGVGARDLGSMAAAGIILLTIAAGASLVPAWRASRVDPATVLRDE